MFENPTTSRKAPDRPQKIRGQNNKRSKRNKNKPAVKAAEDTQVVDMEVDGVMTALPAGEEGWSSIILMNILNTRAVLVEQECLARNRSRRRCDIFYASI